MSANEKTAHFSILPAGQCTRLDLHCSVQVTNRNGTVPDPDKQGPTEAWKASSRPARLRRQPPRTAATQRLTTVGTASSPSTTSSGPTSRWRRRSRFRPTANRLTTNAPRSSTSATTRPTAPACCSRAAAGPRSPNSGPRSTAASTATSGIACGSVPTWPFGTGSMRTCRVPMHTARWTLCGRTCAASSSPTTRTASATCRTLIRQRAPTPSCWIATSTTGTAGRPCRSSGPCPRSRPTDRVFQPVGTQFLTVDFTSYLESWAASPFRICDTVIGCLNAAVDSGAFRTYMRNFHIVIEDSRVLNCMDRKGWNLDSASAVKFDNRPWRCATSGFERPPSTVPPRTPGS